MNTQKGKDMTINEIKSQAELLSVGELIKAIAVLSDVLERKVK